MRLKLIAALLLMGFAMPVQAQEASDEQAQQVREAYLNANKLYGEKKYVEAIKAYNEVRRTMYHPILDYRIGLCYEALKDYNNAKRFYRVYIKYYDQGYPVGRNHPSPEDVRKRIKALESAKAPPVTPAPPVEIEDVEPSAQPTGEDAEAQQAQYAPYTEQAPPGYEQYDHHPPPPPPHHHPGPGHPGMYARWANLFITADVGGTALFGDTAEDAFDQGGGGAWAGIYFRPLPFLSGGLLFGGHGYTLYDRNPYYDSNMTILFAGGAVRGHVPLMGYTWRPWVIELFGELSGGFSQGSIGRDITLRGGFLGAAGGVDLYLARWLSVGILARLAKPFWSSSKIDTAPGITTDLHENNDVSVYFGFSTTLHLHIL